MEAKDIYLTHLMQGPKQFLIPIFQRTYSWTQANCHLLFKDIAKAGDSDEISNHFIGSLVTITGQGTTASIPHFQVIDGQQRLTTITLLLLAMLERAKELECHIIGMTQLPAIKEYYLANTYGVGESKYKLLLTKGDRLSLCSLIDEKPSVEYSSDNVYLNYQFFKDAILNTEMLETIYRGIQKLKVVDVTLHAGRDDPQAIFESLNSTGVDLSQADLIRNFVLMRQPYELQTNLYEEQWYPMERLFGSKYSEKFDRFAQDFLTIQTKSNTLIKSRDVYQKFKHWFTMQTENRSISSVLDELSRYASYYTAFSLRTEKDEDLYSAFIKLRELVEVASPVVMKLYDFYANEQLSKRHYLEAINLLSSYILRRSVCGMQTRSLGNIFAALANRIYESDPLQSLKVALYRFGKNSRFPNNTEFTEALIYGDLYETRICRYVLAELQNNSKEQIDTRSFTIEHVMPQNPILNSEWQKMLGDDWKTIQEMWLHRLGNLTLTAYNSEYKDYSFEKKKTINGGFNESPLRLLNKDIQDTEVWTEKEMYSRAKRLSDKALDIWGNLEVDKSVVAEYMLKDKKSKASMYTLEHVVGFNMNTRELFNKLNEVVSSLSEDITLIISSKNITFYTLDSFLQVIPRKNSLALIFAIDHDELPLDLQDICRPTSDWSFIINGNLNGVYFEYRKDNDLKTLYPLLSMSFEQTVN